MKYSFTRIHKLDTHSWSEINRELRKTMEATIRGKYTEEELEDYCLQAVCDGEPLAKDPNMVFWGYDEPQTMPADCRCEYFYLPTYLIVLTMVAGINHYPKLLELDGVKDTLSRGLFACTGRGLQGSGYESFRILLENLTMFINAGILTFLRNHPSVCSAFGDMFIGHIEHIRNDYNEGKHIADWNEDFRKEQKELLDLYNKNSDKRFGIYTGKVTDAWPGKDYNEHGKRVLEMFSDVPDIDHEYVWYACYGSNLNTERFMRYISRCTDTSAPVEDRPFQIPHNIYFAKTAKTWDNGGKAFLDDTTNGLAYGRIYKITRDQYEQIRHFEGSDYGKQIDLGMTDGLPVYTFTDTQRNVDIRMPSAAYFSTILSGLQECYSGLVDEETLVQYLINAIMPANAYTVAESIRQNDHYLTITGSAEKTGLDISIVIAAVEWLTAHNVIRQDSRSIRAGHSIDDPEAYFYTSDTPCARALIDEMIKAFQAIPEENTEIDEEEPITGGREGARRYVYASRIERNRHNRIEAIRLHGYTCQVCGFNFAKTYGKHGRNYIEVHHVKPLAEQGDGIVNPETDLVCLCANCHRMVHRDGHEVLPIEELRRIINCNH